MAVTLRVAGDSVGVSVRLELQHRNEAASEPPAATGVLLSEDGCSEAASSSGPSACITVQEAARCVSVADCAMRAHAARHARASASPAQAGAREGRSVLTCAATAGEGALAPDGNANLRGSSSASSAHSAADAASRTGGDRKINLQWHDYADGDGACAPQASAQAAAAVAIGDADANKRPIE